VTVDGAMLDRYAALIVRLGANVQPGQIVELRCTLEHQELAHRVVAEAYRCGARFVDVNYFDPAVRRARIEHGDPQTLTFVPSWHGERVLALGEARSARIALGPTHPPGAYDGLDPAAVSREPFPFLREYFTLIDERTTNWTGVCCPTPAWAARVYPDLDPDAALARLWDEVVYCCRLDEPDPIAAWRARFAELKSAETALNEARFDALHFQGPGTDLVLGLLPTSTWDSGISETVDGIPYAANLPTEETFTAPDPRRADGVVRATKPLQLTGGTLVTDLVVRFEEGRVAGVEASAGADALRTLLAESENADRLGEVALVDGAGRVGATGTVFHSTLYDENAASHLALGSAYRDTVGDEDRERVNRSDEHIDFMIGADDVAVTGITGAGERVPILRDGVRRL
jgi:aminopeptidase